MVDPVGPKPVKPGERVVAPVLRASAARPAAQQPQDEPQDAVQTTARQLSGSAPIDGRRVDALRDAIAQGHYVIDPNAIADAMVAMKQAWASNDKA